MSVHCWVVSCNYPSIGSTPSNRKALAHSTQFLELLEVTITHEFWHGEIIIIEDITWPRVGMNFIFECSTRYLTSERSERVWCRVEHEKIKFISTSGHVIFCLLYKHTNDDVFPKISKDFPKLFQREYERFQTFFGHFPKITEYFWIFPRRHRWCFDHTATYLSTF